MNMIATPLIGGFASLGAHPSAPVLTAECRDLARKEPSRMEAQPRGSKPALPGFNCIRDRPCRGLQLIHSS